MPPTFTPLIQALPATVPFVAPEALERQRGRAFRLRLGANESAFGVSPAAREAMSGAAREISWYGEPESFELRQEVARRYAVRVDNVAVGSGIDDLLGLLVRVFLAPGELAVTSLGAYPTFSYHVAGYGGRLEQVPYRDERNDLEALVVAARRRAAKLVYLANPDNPTGTWYESTRLAAFRAALPENCILLLDQAYAELAPPAAMPPVAPDDPGVVVLRTFSKVYGMAGARIGYALAASQTVNACDKVRLHFGINRVAQAGALASLRDDSFVAQVVTAVAAGRCDYETLGRELSLPVLPSATNFVAMDCATRQRADAVTQKLLERDVFIRKPNAPGIDHFIRVSVGSPEDRAAFAEDLRQVLAEL